MSVEGLRVDPAALEQTAKGITGMIDALSEVGFKETAASGRGLALLALSALEAGKASVQTEFESYTERWSWGVRALVQAGNEIAQALGLAAGRYHAMDAKAEEMFKVLWTNLAGNPHLTRDQIAARDWGDTFSDNPFTQVLNADYSRESFDRAAIATQMNMEIIQAVGPQAAANLGVVSNPATLVTGTDSMPAPGWNTGAAAQVEQIQKKYESLLNPQPGQGK
ncbi:hypothetical protein [Nocardia otitidiscaviarum]|uniref:hypothetical protein n=1 Tax=Nocardia otitidiscaviarum TaxID=1823 RepID=UPI001892E877|nr:hypothetical protein [Nocardia otitidiscaviarum]MBF6240218.1 hypothetical protein [Nocardia otitidiscaviarum]